MALLKNKVKTPKTPAAEEVTQEEVAQEEVAQEEVAQEEVAQEKTEEKVEAAHASTQAAAPADVPATIADAGVPAEAIAAAPSLASLKNAMDPETFGNTFKRIVGASGSLKEAGDGVILGKYIDVQLLSSSERYMVVPVADQSDKKSAKFCRASYDGKTIPGFDGDDPQTIKEYTDSVTEYKEFDVKKYLDLYVIIINTEDKDMEELARDWFTVQISISPTAIKAYRAFEMQTPLAVARGVVKATQQNCFRMRALPKSKNGNDWTILEPAVIPHLDIEGYEPIIL